MDSDTFFVEGAALRSLKEHPLCAFVPASVGVAVRDSIAQPAVMLDGMVIDGRARVREAKRIGLRCPCRLFDPDRDGHPALFVANAATERGLTVAQRAVMAARLIRVIMQRPQWLEVLDRGLANRVRTRSGREPLLRACAISTRTYQRVQGIRDDDLLDAISDERVALRDAQALYDLGAARRRRIAALPRDRQKTAIKAAMMRQHAQHIGQLTLLGYGDEDDARASRAFDFAFIDKLGRLTVIECKPWVPSRRHHGYGPDAGKSDGGSDE
ncbi:hypothetical protein SB861_03275 [Paraburkholderia sp. SIMBA_049]